MREECYKKADAINSKIKSLEDSIQDMNLFINCLNNKTHGGNVSRLHHYYNREIGIPIPDHKIKKLLEELKEESLKKLTFLDEEFNDL
jgi:hypothetical protein